jgi:HrpA-like RNA helicase
MVAAAQGNIEALQALVLTKVNLDLKAKNGWTAMDFAKMLKKKEVEKYLGQCMNQPVIYTVKDESGEKRHALEDYHNSFNDEYIDFRLIASIINHIHNVIQSEGAILVFLPGYEDIMTTKDILESSQQSFRICMLHSQMPSR